jgi:plastocyanin
MSRLRTLGAASLVLALLVLPPAISAGQEQSTADSGATTTAPTGSSTTTTAPGDDSSPQPSGGGTKTPDKADSLADPSAPAPAVEVEQDSTETTAVAPDTNKGAVARFASSLTVSIGDNFYSPASVTINAGDTVTWTNNGQATHTATATDGSFNTGNISPGQSRSHTFSQPGTFNYFCQIHGTAQSGTITVASASGGGGGGGGTSEADAVASAAAAGSASTLPLTGENTLVPLAIGLLLLLAGLGLRLRDWVGSA